MKCVNRLSLLKNRSSTLVGMATETKRRRLGVVYCCNRRGVLFKLDKEGNYEVLRGSEDLGIPQSPRVSPGGEWLVWLERDLGKFKGLYPGPHATCMRFVCDVGVVHTVEKISLIKRKLESCAGIAKPLNRDKEPGCKWI